jgi:hypothetical protein
MFPEEADLEAYEAVVDATAEYMAASGDEVRLGSGARLSAASPVPADPALACTRPPALRPRQLQRP